MSRENYKEYFKWCQENGETPVEYSGLTEIMCDGFDMEKTQERLKEFSKCVKLEGTP